MKEKCTYKVRFIPLMLAGIGLFASCELLNEAEGVVPVEISMQLTEVQNNGEAGLPELEAVHLKVNSIALGNSGADLFYLSPSENSYIITPSDNSTVLIEDYIPRDSFHNFDLRLGNTFIASDSSGSNQIFIEGIYKEQPFNLSLIDTLHVLYEFNSPLNVFDNSKATVFLDVLVDYSQWFVNEDGTVIDPVQPENAVQIYHNIQQSISVRYAVKNGECPKEACGNSNSGKDSETLVEIIGDERAESEDSLLFKVVLSEPLNDSVRVSYATSDNSAKSNSDYISAVDELLFLPGEVSKQIQISIIDDTLKEADEHFTVEISDVMGANLNRSKSRAQGVILNDDESSKGNSGGNGGSNGKGGGNDNGQGDDKGNGQGNGNGDDKGNGQDSGNGDDKGNGQGNGEDQGNGDGDDKGNGQGNGNGDDKGNGQGNGNGDDKGNGRHKKIKN